jgi:hypothetical protein
MESAVELQAIADLYFKYVHSIHRVNTSSMMKSCQKKCLTRHGKSLDEHENMCDELCVQKYLKVHQQVGKVMQAATPQAK